MRISSLPSLGRCPGLWLLRQREPGVPGAAADTGSAVGRAIRLYHEGYAIREACELALGEHGVAAYPRADAARARRLALAYAADPENPPGAATRCEAEVAVELTDADGAPLRMVGHVDQARGDAVWDVKSGAGTGPEMLGDYALQLAGYVVAAHATWGAARPGGIIRLAAYESGGSPARWEAPWGLPEARALLEVVRREAAALRSGRCVVRPGPHCAWCPAGNPGVCLERLRREPPRAEEVS